MISGRRSETTYDATENLKPGKISSVTAAPPSTCLRSSTTTFFPALARYAAVTRPLCPPPMMMASYFCPGFCFAPFVVMEIAIVQSALQELLLPQPITSVTSMCLSYEQEMVIYCCVSLGCYNYWVRSICSTDL